MSDINPCCGKRFCECSLAEIREAFRQASAARHEAERERDTWKELAQKAEAKAVNGVGNTEPKPFSWLCKCGGELSTTLDVCCFCWRDRAASEVLPQANPHPNCGQYPNCGCGPTGKCAAAFTSQGNPA